MTTDPYTDPYGDPIAQANPYVEAGQSIAQFIGVDDSILGNPYVGVPVGYKAPGNFVQPPVTAPRFTGTEPTPVQQFTKPIYQQSDLAALAGAPPDQVVEWQKRLYNMGFMPDNFMIGIYDEATHDALEAAMTVANANGYTIGQMEKILRQGSKTAEQMGWTSSSGGSGAGTSYEPYTTTTNSTTVSTQENINLTGRGGARALLVQALANEIGREPTRKEVTRFLNSLNRAERRNPSVSKSRTESTSTTTTDPSPSGDTSVTSNTKNDTTTTTRQSDLDPSQKAIQWARQHGGNEAKRYQSANFFSVIEAMVGL